MVVTAAATGKVVLIVLVCVVAGVLAIWRWNHINRRHQRHVAERQERDGA